MHEVNGLTRRWRLPAGCASMAGAGVGPSCAGALGGRGLVGVVARPGAGAGASLLDRLLAARGLDRPEAVRSFCEPRLSDLHDPRLLPGIDCAAHRLVEAVRRRERIAIYGDYDVDGITATAILFHVIRAADADASIRCYVPHRLEEGYGLNADALRQLAAEGVSLAVSVDCGVTAVAPAQAAREAGLDLVITDHHEAPRDPALLPPALAIVHPALPGSTYPFPDLCGAGVAFKLAWRFAAAWCGSDRVSERFRQALLQALPLAALGTIADVVPLVGENRIFASVGLRAIVDTPLTGLRALIHSAGLAGDRIDTEKVGFILAPRLNACGRLGHAADAVRLLTEAGPVEAAQIAQRLAELNRDRQRTEAGIAAQAAELAEALGQTGADHRAIVLAHEEWHPGVVGIVCSRLVERFGRPTVLLQRRGELCRGSARSVPGYSIHEALSACAAELVAFGGHAAAAGLSVRTDRLEAFRAALVEHANARLAPTDLVPRLDVDCTARLPELSPEAVAAIGRLSPFGRENPRPALLVEDAIVASAPQRLKDRHLKLHLRQEGPEGAREVEAIWWNGAAHAEALHRGRRIHAVVDPRISGYTRRVEAELRDAALAS